MEDTDTEGGVCSNCGSRAFGRFCSQCGKRWFTTVPGLREFLGEVSEEFGGVGTRFFRTLTAVMTRPGLVSLAYAEGRGGRYVPPVRFYLTVALAYLAVSALLPVSPPFVAAMGFFAGDDFIQVWLPRVIIFAVPVLAGIIKLLYPGEPFVRHLVFSFNLHAMFYVSNIVWESWAQLAESTALPAAPGETLLLTVWHLSYMFFGFRRLQGGGVRAAASVLGVGVLNGLSLGLLILALMRFQPEFVDQIVANATEQAGVQSPSVSGAEVRAAREAFNGAIAERDLDVIDGLLMESYHIIAGRSSQYVGRDANVELWRGMFESDPTMLYVRTPREVRVNEAFGLAEELGDWAGNYVSGGEPGEASGVYAAKWQRTSDGHWLLQSEVFTTLECSGGPVACLPPDPMGPGR